MFVGRMCWYLYLAGNDVEIHFDNLPVDNAVYEQGGLIGDAAASQVPDSAGSAHSGISKDLHGGQFKKKEKTAGSDASTTV